MRLPATLSTRRVRHGPQTEDVSCRGVLPTGVPILPKEISCPLCTINVYGDHATCCSKPVCGDLIVRHNAMRNLVNEIADVACAGEEGILGNAPGRRPGDVTISLWEKGRAPSTRRRGVEELVIRTQPQAREIRQGFQGVR